MQVAVRGIEEARKFAYHFDPGSNDEDVVGKYVARYPCIFFMLMIQGLITRATMVIENGHPCGMPHILT